MYKKLSRAHPGILVPQILTLGYLVAFALYIWCCLQALANIESPIVVVLSGSMEPGIHRGDLLFLAQRGSLLKAGDIIVFDTKVKDIPIVHRIVEVRTGTGNTTKILTKGDNNFSNDRFLYEGKEWLNPEKIQGRVLGIIPKIGMFTIYLNKFKWFKYLCLALFGLLLIRTRE